MLQIKPLMRKPKVICNVRPCNVRPTDYHSSQGKYKNFSIKNYSHKCISNIEGIINENFYSSKLFISSLKALEISFSE